MKALKHIYQQPFVFATGLAALIHSTWALGTLFSGQAPTVDWQSWEWYEWIVPALLISFAMDVGQISTSSHIRENGLTKARAFTFVIFAVATYYLQWLYMAVHMPLLDISAGVTGNHTAVAENMRNWAIWLIPALLPISTVSYTFSGNKTQKQKNFEQPIDLQIISGNVQVQEMEMPLLVAENPIHDVECLCGWQRTYDNPDSSTRGLNAHQQKCSIYQESAKIEVSQ